MIGIEKMLSSMIGMTPEQMTAKLAEFEAFVKGGSQALVSIAETQNKILAELEAMKNGGK